MASREALVFLVGILALGSTFGAIAFLDEGGPGGPGAGPGAGAGAEARPVFAPNTTAGHTWWDDTVEGEGGVQLALTVFKPGNAAAGPDTTVPLILHSHGWSQTRATEPTPFISTLLDHGYGVVSLDMRGHGGSGGQAHVHDPDREVRDVSHVLDWAWGELDWVTHQDAAVTGHERDLLVGSAGGSYGGAWQLLAAALDGRLDALVPEITWNELPRSLAPNGAIKSDWVHLLYLGAKATGTTVAPEIDEAYQQAMLTNELPPDILDEFARSSPASYPGAIDVPTLLVQGVPDTLFNLNEAVDNLALVAATGADARLFTHLGGHNLHPAFLDERLSPLGPLPVVQPLDGRSPCGDLTGGPDDVRLAWYDHHLKAMAGRTATVAPVSLAIDDGHGCLRTNAWPPVDEPTPTAATQPSTIVLPQAGAGASVPALLGQGPMTLTGIPVINATVEASGVQTTVYFSLEAVGPDGPRVLGSQVTALRLDGPLTGETVRLEMGAIASNVTEDEQLVLRVATWNDQFATNAGRASGGLVLSAIVVDLPLIENADGGR